MNVTCASEFLAGFAQYFSSDEVRAWPWTEEDEQFGKRASWPVGDSVTMEATASVELTEAQLQLTITERDIATSTEGEDARVAFDALLVFEESTLTVDGEPLEYTPVAIVETIRQFNLRA